MLFDAYMFADYSGAASPAGQRKSIRLALGEQNREPEVIDKRFTRETLVKEYLSLLREATRGGRRLCFGQDHQYSIPIGFANELGIHELMWREAIAALVNGAYGEGAPALSGPATFGAALNRWLVDRGSLPYFYSATKPGYRVPSSDPRPKEASSYRLTERCRAGSDAGHPKSFSRLGDPGSVGGQTLWGMASLHVLLGECEREGIPVAVGPFDGLAIDSSSYENSHVMVEPYPTALRDRSIRQSDDADALGIVAFIRDHEHRGDLIELLSLEDLSEEEKKLVRFEGWILGHSPGRRRFGRN